MVEDFVIGRHGFGKIFFPGQTDLAGLNLDELGERSMYLTNVHVIRDYICML